jgi:DNA-binding NarL/FixJ family response regulator
VRVLLVDDHALMREGLVLLIAAVDAAVKVDHAATIAQALQRLAAGPDPDLVLLDLGLPDAIGLDGLARVREAAESLPVVVLSGHDAAQTVRECIDAGAMGFIPKSVSSATMIGALNAVIAGSVWLPPFLLDAATPARMPPALLERLTPRQREVLACIVHGMTNRAIALKLGITELTVKSHVTALLEALEVRNRTEAVFAVRDLRL